MTVGFDGSLKAEHATGRNMVPFLAAEWGEEATELMWRVKRLIDPCDVLAPGVVLDRDPEAHLRGLKSLPAIEPLADPCIECGFCEAVCPSRDLTATPRQRIVLRREMPRQPAGSPVAANLVDSYGYDAVDTCAGDSACKLACPVGIDTGAMMKAFRHQRHSPREERIAARAATSFAAVESAARAALRVAARMGDRTTARTTALLRSAVSPDLAPHWLAALLGPVRGRLPKTDRATATAVYYVACVNRIFTGPESADGLSLPEALVAVSARAGRPVWIPPDLAGSCCATIWHSKGYEDGQRVMSNRIVERAWEWTDGGRLPLVVDASSCTLGIADDVSDYLTAENRRRHTELTVLDSLEWAARELLPHLRITRRVGSAVVPPTCSMRHLGDADALTTLAAAYADDVCVPVSAECCGFAGDRGLLHPELTEAATAQEAAEVAARAFDTHVSANRTCEIGMQHATGHPYHSVLIDLERASRPGGADGHS